MSRWLRLPWRCARPGRWASCGTHTLCRCCVQPLYRLPLEVDVLQLAGSVFGQLCAASEDFLESRQWFMDLLRVAGDRFRAFPRPVPVTPVSAVPYVQWRA